MAEQTSTRPKKPWLLGMGLVAGAVAGSIAVQRARQAALEREERIQTLAAAEATAGKNIVILGAGFGGINAAIHLIRALPEASGWKVTLVDRTNYFLFTPLLYHVASGLVDPSSVLYPVRTLTSALNFVFREATVLGVDFDRQCVALDDGELPYDHLILALGSVTNYFGKEQDLKQCTLPLKDVADSLRIRNRIIDDFENADITTDPEERRQHLTFAIVGGGATGIELAGSIRGLIYGTLSRQYPRIQPEECRILVFEALSTILPGLPPELSKYALKRLRDLGVEVRLETPVERVDADGLLTKSGEFIPTRTVVWTAGVRPSPLVDRLDVPKAKNGRILVNQYQEICGRPNCYALGDIAAFQDEETGKLLPPNAAVAVRAGKALARHILAKLEGREPQPLHYVQIGELVSLGRHDAVADIRGVRITGFPAWLLWRAFYLSQLMGFKNQLEVALDWSFAYFYQRDTMRLELPAPSSEAVELY